MNKTPLELKEEDLANISDSDWEKMVDYLHVMLSDEDKDFLHERMLTYGKDWMVGLHFNGGMFIRNLLRSGGFSEKRIGILDLDNVYIPILEEAILEHK